MALADVLKALGAGAQHGYDRGTLGPDYAERLAKVREALLASSQTRRIQGEVADRSTLEADTQRQAEELEAQNATYPPEPGEDPSNVTVTPLDSTSLVAKLRATKAAEDRGLTTRKVESEILENEANAVNLASKPDLAQQGIELRIQALQQAQDRAQDANERAALGREIQLMKIQQAQNQFDSREGRLQGQFESRTQVDASTRERLAVLGSARMQLGQLRNLLKDPKVAQYLGPIAGRITVAQMTKGGGIFTDPKQREVMIRVARAFNTAANAFGGKVLPPNEQERVAQAEVYNTDTLAQMFQKAGLAFDIYDTEVKRRLVQLGPEAKKQMRGYMAFEGIEFPELPEESQTNATPDTAQPTVPATSPGKAREVVPGGANAPAPTGEPGPAKKPRMRWDSRLGKFVPVTGGQ